MIPEGVTSRSDLQVAGGVLAFDFTRDISQAHVAHILASVDRTSTRFVVLDLRNMHFVSSPGMGQLLLLRRQLQEVPCRVVLLVDQRLREIIAATRLDQAFSVVADEPQLRALVEVSTASARASAQGDEPPAFTQAELAEMDAGCVTLDDAIRSVERLRG